MIHVFDKTQFNDREKHVSRCSNVVEKSVRIRRVESSFGPLTFWRTNTTID